MNIHRRLSDRSLTRLNVALTEAIRTVRVLKGYSAHIWHVGDDGEEMSSIAFTGEDDQFELLVEKSGFTVFRQGREAVYVSIDQKVLKANGVVNLTCGPKTIRNVGSAAAAIRAAYLAAGLCVVWPLRK